MGFWIPAAGRAFHKPKGCKPPGCPGSGACPRELPHALSLGPFGLRGPTAILFIDRAMLVAIVSQNLRSCEGGTEPTNLGEGPPAEPRHEVFSLKFLQFCCAGPWEFRAEVFAKGFFCSECPSKTRPKTSRQTSRKTSPLQNGNFAQNFALQKPIANKKP